MPSYAIIGASRGIGLEFVRQLAARPDATVIAVVRNPTGSTHLHAAIEGLHNVHIVSADVADYSTLERAAKQVSGITGGILDVLIHNAALADPTALMKGFDDYSDMDELDAAFTTAFKVNALGPIHAITAFLPLLRASSTKKIVVISSAGADHKLVRTVNLAHMSAYGMTKAAALMATTKLAVQLEREGFVVISLSPGMVDVSATAVDSSYARTRETMDRAAAVWKEKCRTPFVVISTEASVAGQLKVIDGLKPSDNGLFLTEDGVEWAVPT